MPEPTPAIRAAILAAAERHGLDPALVFGVVEVESSFDPNAVGDSGHSIGLGQLHDQGAGAGMTVEERQDPEKNLERVCEYLREAGTATEGRITAVISAYNQGIGGFAENGWTRVNPVYVAKVLDAYRRWTVRLIQETILPEVDTIWGMTRSGRIRDHLLIIKQKGLNLS